MTARNKPTIGSIAALAGVSKSTVSMILSEKEGVSFNEDTVAKVKEAADRVGYVRRQPAPRRDALYQKTILVISPSMANPYYSILAQAIEEKAEQKGLNVLLYNTFRDREKELLALSVAKDTPFYGVISTMAPQIVEELEDLNATSPVVIIGDRNNDYNLDTVEINNYTAGVLIAEHMIGLGHKHIAYISTTLDNINSARVRRLEGLKDTYDTLCPEGSIVVKAMAVSAHEERRVIDIEHQVGHRLTLEFLKEHKHVTGIVAVNDMVAYGIMDALMEQKLRIPEDYSLCGFDNIFPSRMGTVALTTVEHYIENKGQNAVEMLVNRREGKTPANSLAKVLYKHELVVRRSTGAPREQRPK